jgi:4'-phosphopantetheinyl transferase
MTQVRVWSVPVDEATPAAAADLALLDTSERARADRFMRERDRVLYVAAHAALRRVLSGETGIAPATLAFTAEPAGKPLLLGPGPAFNISHTRGHVLIAVSDRPVGVDVEVLRPLDDASRLARRVMTDAEFAGWLALPADLKIPAFLRMWCVKESWLKARGMGLHIDPASVESRIGLDQSIPDETGGPWQVRRLAVGPRHFGAVAVAGSAIEVVRVSGL